jgi:hypothetical protein
VALLEVGHERDILRADCDSGLGDLAMPLQRLWVGRAFGTSTGNLFIKFDGPDNNLTGVLRFNEEGVGLVVYNVTGTFDGTVLRLDGTLATPNPNYGRLTVSARLTQQGTLHGEWGTEVGTAGTFGVRPDDPPPAAAVGAAAKAEQLYTKRVDLQPVEVTRNQLIELADFIQKQFETGRVIVTIETTSQQAVFLEEFKSQTPTTNTAILAKLFVQEPERGGLSRVVHIEFGQQVNFIFTQGPDESWVLGQLEKLRSAVHHLERGYSTNIKWVGASINQIMLVGAVAFLPSLDTFWKRAVLLVGVILLAWLVTQFHNRYLPHAAIYLTQKRDGFFAKYGLSILSWVVGIIASVTAGLLGAFLKGWLQLPG